MNFTNVIGQDSNSNEFEVDIYFVGRSALLSQEITPIKDNIYRLEDPSTIVPVTIKFNISGWTSWDLGNVSLQGFEHEVDFGNQSITNGQIFCSSR